MLKPRKAIVGLPPYQSPILGRANLNLDLNENAAGCSPRVLERLRKLSPQEVARYPLREGGERVVANFLSVEPGQVLLTNGVDDALLVLFATYLGDGDEMILADPTFVMYPFLGRALGAQVVRVRSGADLSFPTGALIGSISPRTRLIAIANPNNPTGGVIPRVDLLRIVETAPNAAVLVDEAYFDFCGETMIPELARHRNLFVARTFSKAYGLAGLRLGALIGVPDQVEYVRRFCPPFNVNAVVLACLEESLADQEFVSESVRQAREGRDRLVKLCQELKLDYWPSQTNFVLVRIGSMCRPFVEAMRQRGVMVRDMSASPRCEGCVRITMATPQQMDELLQAMRAAIEDVRSGASRS